MNNFRRPPARRTSGPPIDPANPLPEKDYRAERRIQETIGNSQEVLFKASTVFPFTLFPDTAAVDREKLTIAHRFFFRVAEVTTIRVEDILNVTADMGPWFGSLKIHSRFFNPDKPHEINFLRRGDAYHLKCILQGYVIALQKQIDCSQFNARQLTNLLVRLGQGAPGEDF